MNDHGTKLFVEFPPCKWWLRFAIFGILLSVLTFLIMHLFMHRVFIDYKPNIEGGGPPQSIVEAKSLAIGIPVNQVASIELQKVDSDPVTAICCLTIGFASACIICKITAEISAQRHRNKP